MTTSRTKRLTRLENLVLASGHLLKTLQQDPSPVTWTTEFASLVQAHIRECIQVENSIKQRAKNKAANREKWEAGRAAPLLLPPTKEPLP